jgi:uncharacterized protein (TIRG00374 family)
MKRWGLLLVGFIISLGAMAYLVRGDIQTLRSEAEGGRYEYVAPTLILFVAALVTRGIRWRVLLGGKTSAWHAFHIMNIGYMLNNLPLRVGELARAWLTTRLDPPIPFFTAFSSITVERLLDVFSVLVILALSLVFLPVPTEMSLTGAAFGLISLIAGGVLVYFSQRREVPHRLVGGAQKLLPPLGRLKLSDWLDHFLDGLLPLSNPRLRWQALFWTFISWTLSVAVGYLLMFVFFDRAHFAGILLTIFLLSMAVAIPAMPGSFGVFEGAAVAGLWIAGVIASTAAPDNAPALAFAVLLHLITIVGYILLGLFGLWAEGTTLGQVRAGMDTLKNETPSA